MKKRLSILVAIAAPVLVPVGAVLAYPDEQCARDKMAMIIPGTNAGETIYESPGNDCIRGFGVRDIIIRADIYPRPITDDPPDLDYPAGDRGDDIANVADGDSLDTANENRGRGKCIVDDRSEVGNRCERVEIR